MVARFLKNEQALPVFRIGLCRGTILSVPAVGATRTGDTQRLILPRAHSALHALPFAAVDLEALLIRDFADALRLVVELKGAPSLIRAVRRAAVYSQAVPEQAASGL